MRLLAYLSVVAGFESPFALSVRFRAPATVLACAIKLVMDLESRRIDMLQKAGLLENKELAEEMLQIEERQETLIGILKDIAAEHPEIRDKIMRRLSEATKPGETVTIVSD